MTARLALIGLVAGVFSTLFGVGGGIVVVPLLVALAAFPTHTAAATSLGAILVTATAGAVLYAARGEVRPWYAALVGIPAVGGSAARDQSAATRLRKRADAGPRRAARRHRRVADPRMTTWTIVAAIALGLGAGVLSGMFGVGGGILFVPTLVLLGLGQVEASATSLLAIVPTAAAGAWRQRAYGNLRIRAALVVGVVSVLGAEVGVQIATRIDESLLRRLFGLLMIGVAAQLAVRTVRQGRRYPDGS